MLPLLTVEQFCRCGEKVAWGTAIVLTSPDGKYAGVSHPECMEESDAE